MTRQLTILATATVFALVAPVHAELFNEDVTVQEDDPDFILFEFDETAFWFLESEDSTFQISDNVTTSVLQIEENAPDDMLYIANDGSVGIGTAAPFFDFEIFDPDSSNFASLGLTTSEGATWVLSACLFTCSGLEGFRLVQGDSPTDPSPLWIENGSQNRSIFIDSSGISFNGAVIQMSSRDAKTDFEAVDTSVILARVLELPLQTWSYKSHADSTHLGPIAEDFYEAFGLGSTDRGIATVDSAGVALAAIQGLEARHRVEMAELSAGYEERLASLEARLNHLATLVQQANDAPGTE